MRQDPLFHIRLGTTQVKEKLHGHVDSVACEVGNSCYALVILCRHGFEEEEHAEYSLLGRSRKNA